MNDEQDIDILDKETVYDGFFRMERYRLRHRKFDGSWTPEVSREIFERGNAVAILHDFGFNNQPLYTLYAHMVAHNVYVGQEVKTGDVLGWVGSTGKSTGPHCHYEVHINGNEVDPVYFFYNDLTPEQFDRLLKKAANGSAKSLD